MAGSSVCCGRFVRRVSRGGGHVFGASESRSVSAMRGGRNFVQRGGRSGVLPLLLSRGGAARSLADSDFHGRAKSGAGATAAQGTRSAIRTGIRILAGMAGRGAHIPAQRRERSRRNEEALAQTCERRNVRKVFA